MECNDKLLHHNVSTAEEDVGVTGFCLDVVDTLLLEQVRYFLISKQQINSFFIRFLGEQTELYARRSM